MFQSKNSLFMIVGTMVLFSLQSLYDFKLLLYQLIAISHVLSCIFTVKSGQPQLPVNDCKYELTAIKCSCTIDFVQYSVLFLTSNLAITFARS